MADHPIRSTAIANSGAVTGTLLDAFLQRMPLAIGPSESLADIAQVAGSVPLAVVHSATGQVFFYDEADTTTLDDGLTCLVDGNGHRYKLSEAAALQINSVLAMQNAPPGSPSIDDVYVVDTAPTGAWASRAKSIAIYTSRGWVFATPSPGVTVLNEATGKNIQYDETGTWGGLEIEFAAGSIDPVALAFPMGLAVEAQQNAPPVTPTVGPHYLVGTAGSGDWAGHSNDIAYLDDDAVTWAFFDAYDGATIYNKSSAASLVYHSSSGTWEPPFPLASTCQGRLTLESGVAISTTDQTAKGTLYFTPFRGNNIALYVNGGWALRTFTEKSLSLASYTTGKPYDIFGYDDSGVLAIESLVWTNDTTRATALTLQDGIHVKSSDATRRYLGTIYTTATGQTEDSAAKRMVWNHTNRVKRPMRRLSGTSAWTYDQAVLRQANSETANQLEFVIGVSEDAVDCAVTAGMTGSARIAIGLDSTTTAAAGALLPSGETADSMMLTAHYSGFPGAGRHRLTWLEASIFGTITFYGTEGGTFQSGLQGSVLA